MNIRADLGHIAHNHQLVSDYIGSLIKGLSLFRKFKYSVIL